MNASPRCRIRWAVLVLVTGSLGSARMDAATVYVSTSGNNANTGLSWTAAKRTVQAGLSAAHAGDQVWVAAGTYVERVSLTLGAELYGGFAGTETSVSQRNWTAHVTVLDGNQAGSVVTAPTGATQATRIDGFTLRNGTGTAINSYRYGGGIYCKSASPTIANNTILYNTASLNGAGIYCDSSTAIITGNFIAANRTTGTNLSFGGGGIYWSSGAPTIVNNTITANSSLSGAGIFCSSVSILSSVIANNVITGNTGYQGAGILCVCCSPQIISNTITGNSANQGGGIYCIQSSPPIANTIVAFNSSGICSDTSALPPLSFNCLYGNVTCDYSSSAKLIGINGNISVDPKLANVPYGVRPHLQPGSPCIDAGLDSAVLPTWKDIDGQPRILGSHVDIGADESDGATWPTGPYVTIRVAPEGNDANDGSSWPLAKRTVQAAIDIAAVYGGDIWVKAGTYPQRITLRPQAHLYGGFAGTETQRSARDPSRCVTILDGAQGGSVVTASQIVAGTSTLDGFTICNGKVSTTDADTGGGGIYCSYAAPAIVNNTITGNSAYDGGGILFVSSPVMLTNNTIVGNTATRRGGGIYTASSVCPTITNNRILRNVADMGAGIFCEYSPWIYNNTIAGNKAASCGGGIYTGYCEQIITSNIIIGNSANAGGSGICSRSATLNLLNCTIVCNNALAGGAVDCSSYTVIADNIIAFNSAGIYKSPSADLVLRYNCVYANTLYDYFGVEPPAGSGNIAADPLFVRAPSPGRDGVWGTPDDDYGDLHLLPGSPCIDAGSIVNVPADLLDLDADGYTIQERWPFDFDGNPRLADDPATPDTGDGATPVVDIGAYEKQPLLGDVNGDGAVDVVDLLWLVDSFGKVAGDTGFDPRCDFNADGSVDVVDVLYMVENFGK